MVTANRSVTAVTFIGFRTQPSFLHGATRGGLRRISRGCRIYGREKYVFVCQVAFAQGRDSLVSAINSATIPRPAVSEYTDQTVARIVGFKADPEIGEFDIPGLAAKFSRWAPRGDVKADRLGEHNEQILRDILKLSDAEIRQLYLNKTIVRDPLLERENA